MCEYAGLIIGSIAFITQLMSIFGLFSGINLAVWHFGVGIGGMLIGNVASLLRWWAYDSAWAYANDKTKKDDDKTKAKSAASSIKLSWIEEMALSTSAGLTLYS